MDDLHEILICATLCIRWLSVQYNNKKQGRGKVFYVGGAVGGGDG